MWRTHQKQAQARERVASQARVRTCWHARSSSNTAPTLSTRGMEERWYDTRLDSADSWGRRCSSCC